LWKPETLLRAVGTGPFKEPTIQKMQKPLTQANQTSGQENNLKEIPKQERLDQ
jgi:hypothetical protein